MKPNQVQYKRYSKVKSAYWKVIGNSSSYCSTSITLNPPRLKYAFNCSKGYERLSQEKISNLKDLFLTRMSWLYKTGDLAKLLQTLAACNVSEITIHGPPELKDFVALLRPFIDESLKINTSVCESGEWFEDRSVKLRYISFEQSNSDESPVIAYAGLI